MTYDITKAVKELYTKFSLNHEGNPRPLSKEEYHFRIQAMFEEVMEYMAEVIDFSSEETPFDPKRLAAEAIADIADLPLHEDVGSPERLEGQFDAMLDLMMFAQGTNERQGFPARNGIIRVHKANMAKELASNGNELRSFKRDLVKPDGWKAPVLIDLVQPASGLIILEGPDGTGKTTLASHIVERFGGKIIHRTWSQELEERMDEYLMEAVDEAIELSKTQVVVIDRLFLSEIIYSEVFREGTQYPNLATDIIKKLRNTPTMQIFCLPTCEATEKQYLQAFNELRKERTEMYDDMENVMRAFHSFLFNHPSLEKYNHVFTPEHLRTLPNIVTAAGIDPKNMMCETHDRFQDPTCEKALIDVRNFIMAIKDINNAK